MAIIIIKSERILGYVCEARIVSTGDDQPIAKATCGQEISDRWNFEDVVEAAGIHVDQCEGPAVQNADYGVHRCQSCGSTRWVGWSVDGGQTRRAQCTPCGKVGDRIGKDETHRSPAYGVPCARAVGKIAPVDGCSCATCTMARPDGART